MVTEQGRATLNSHGPPEFTCGAEINALTEQQIDKRNRNKPGLMPTARTTGQLSAAALAIWPRADGISTLLDSFATDSPFMTGVKEFEDSGFTPQLVLDAVHEAIRTIKINSCTHTDSLWTASITHLVEALQTAPIKTPPAGTPIYNDANKGNLEQRIKQARDQPNQQPAPPATVPHTARPHVDRRPTAATPPATSAPTAVLPVGRNVTFDAGVHCAKYWQNGRCAADNCQRKNAHKCFGCGANNPNIGTRQCQCGIPPAGTDLVANGLFHFRRP